MTKTELIQEVRQLSEELQRLRGEKSAEDTSSEGALLKTLLCDHMADSAFALNQKGHILDVNAAACHNLNYPRDELLGMSVFDISVGMTPELWLERWDYQRKHGRSRLLGIHRRKDGSTFPVNVGSSYCKAAENEFVCACAHDISDDDRIDKHVQELALYPEENPNPVMRVHRDGSVQYANQCGRRILERLGTELGARISDSWMEVVANVFEERIPREIEQTVDDQTFSLTFASAPDKEHLNIYGLDISPRVKAQRELKRLALAVDHAEEMIVITDTKGVVEFVNPVFERISGYSSDEVLGKNMSLLKSEIHDQAFFKEFWECILRGDVWRGRIVNRKKDGQLFKQQSTVAPILNRTGEVVSFVAVQRDVTREEELENQLRQSQKLEAVGLLAGGIAHDFNNILQVILGFIGIAADDVEPGSAMEECLTEAHLAAKRAATLVSRISTFSRQADVELKPMFLQDEVEEALDFLRSTLPPAIDIRRDIDETCSAIVADASQIQQVIVNLVTNARHAIVPAKGWIQIRLMCMTRDSRPSWVPENLQGDRFVALTISDSGSGMPKEIIDRIFEPFFTTKDKGKGLGLGLSIVHGIVTDCRGEITVESTPGVGTSFRLFFPVSDVDVEAGPEKSNLEMQRAQGEHRIMFIDDDDAILRLSKIFLERAGYRVQAYQSSEAALEAFSANSKSFDLAVIDYLMPSLTGIELSEKLLQIRSDVPIILCTGHAEEMNYRALSDMGIRKVLKKPVEAKKLVEVVAAILASP